MTIAQIIQATRRSLMADVCDGRCENERIGISVAINLPGGDRAVIRAWRGPRGALHSEVARRPGHVTDERPTGGLADMIRDARADCC